MPPDVTACVDSRFLGDGYAYLLGLYLGDGCISASRRGVWVLRITLDAKYPRIIQGCGQAIWDLKGTSPVYVNRPGYIEVDSHWKHWVCVFPQAGPGPKHRRRVELTEWQSWIVQRHPRMFIRGLIHSDGCRVMNTVWKGKYSYSRYHFTNESADIRGLFAWACRLIQVDSRPNNRTNISVARRRSVAILDEFVGPKA